MDDEIPPCSLLFSFENEFIDLVFPSKLNTSPYFIDTGSLVEYSNCRLLLVISVYHEGHIMSENV